MKFVLIVFLIPIVTAVPVLKIHNFQTDKDPEIIDISQKDYKPRSPLYDFKKDSNKNLLFIVIPQEFIENSLRETVYLGHLKKLTEKSDFYVVSVGYEDSGINYALIPEVFKKHEEAYGRNLKNAFQYSAGQYRNWFEKATPQQKYGIKVHEDPALDKFFNELPNFVFHQGHVIM